MAQISMDGLDGLMLSLKELAELPEQIQDDILNAQADIVVNAQKSKGTAMGIPEGEMLDSIKKTKVKKGKSGKYISIYPQGSRKRGNTVTREAEIGFLQEYGYKKVSGKPFIRMANEETSEEQTKAALEVLDKYYKSKNL